MRVSLEAEDPIVRGALARALIGAEGSSTPQVVVVEPGRAEAEAAGVDVVVLDMGPRGEALASSAWLAAPLVALVSSDEDARRALARGARGVLRREVDGAALTAGIVAVHHGLSVVDGALNVDLGEGAPTVEGEGDGGVEAEPRPEEPREPLTARERQVLGLLAEGRSNREIAQTLGISEHTVKFHVNAVLTKLGAGGRLQAVVRAARLGILDL